jgi:hypothetical protein
MFDLLLGHIMIINLRQVGVSVYLLFSLEKLPSLHQTFTYI